MKWTADFETTTDPEDCRVWAWGVCSIEENMRFEYGNSLDTFMVWLTNHINNTLYFHNLKFDGEFIMSYLFKNGWRYQPNYKEIQGNEFNILMNSKGQIYTLTLCFMRYAKARKEIRIVDSLKILNFTVAEIAQAFALPIEKGEIDYDEYREIGHKLTSNELKYLKNDVEIPAMALKVLFDQNLTKITQGSNALASYKDTVSKKLFNYWFPQISNDEFVRKSYKGAFTYLNPKFKGKEISEGIVLDVNSLYPYVMRNCMLPFGQGLWFDGEYQDDPNFPLYVVRFTCNFKVKEGMLPTIQLKHNLGFVPTEYVEEALGDEIEMTLTNIDLKLFLEHYEVFNIDWIGGYKFRQSNQMFCNYIDHWIGIKNEATINGNKPMRTLAKLMLNALYGKFALNPKIRSKHPYLNEDGVIKYYLGELEHREPLYIPVGTFITAYARDITIRAAQANIERFIYADTDSLHLCGLQYPDLEIDKVKLGAWKHESTFVRAKFLRSKCYYEEEVDNTFWCEDLGLYGSTSPKITVAGMPKSCYKYVTWDNFKEGSTFEGKLRHTSVAGGVVLLPTPFTLKA